MGTMILRGGIFETELQNPTEKSFFFSISKDEEKLNNLFLHQNNPL
jgi:hypothetical protein